jgi:Tfp pilus assembly protein PilO
MRARLQLFLEFTRHNPVIVLSLAVILLMGSASYFLWQRQHNLTVDHETLRRNGEDMMQSLTGSARIAAEMAAVTEAMDFLDANLINEGDLAENLGYFYQIESAARIRFSQVNQLSSQPQPADSQFKAVPFTLRATGTYRQIIRLLHELETGPRQLRIRTYTFTQSEGGAAASTPEAPAPGSGAAPGAGLAGGPAAVAAAAADLITMELFVEVLARP